MADRLLRLDRVTAGYGPTVVVEDVSLALEAGETLALLGRNGVGKSTLMRTIMGHTRLHGGSAHLDGVAIERLPAFRRSALGIGYVPQERDIFRSLSVEENLTVAQRPGRWTVEAVYGLFPNLAARRANNGLHLSGGEQQMLSIGRALVGNPRLLLLDEPLEGLAPVVIEQILKALYAVRQGGELTVVLVEQYARLALQFASRAVVLDRGRMVFDGAAATLAGDAALMGRYLGVMG